MEERLFTALLTSAVVFLIPLAWLLVMAAIALPFVRRARKQ